MHLRQTDIRRNRSPRPRIRTATLTLTGSDTPANYQLDLRVDKTFNIGPFDANLYLWITNVFNTRNVINVFPQTGDAYDDGYLTSDEGSATIESYRLKYGDEVANQYKSIYSAISYNSGNFGTPRQIRLGLRFDF